MVTYYPMKFPNGDWNTRGRMHYGIATYCSRCRDWYPFTIFGLDLIDCPQCGNKVRHGGKRSPHALKHHNEMRKIRGSA